MRPHLRSVLPTCPFLAALALSTGVVLPTRADYATAVLADKPLAYYRMNESGIHTNLALNSGSLGASGTATNLEVYPTGGALAGSRDAAAYFHGAGARSIIPFNAANNPPSSSSFTIEAWVQPTKEVTDAPGPAPLMNRYSYSGVDRQGWVFFQRSPTTGWNFRTYSGSGSSTGINITGQASTPGAGTAGSWNHLVATWDGTTSTATLYVNGEQVAEAAGTYMANTDDHDPAVAVRGPSGLCIGSYNNTEPGANPFQGAVDEVAVYATKLSAAQVLAHYQNGLDATRATAYPALVQADKPVSYLRFDGTTPDADVAVNLGSLGAAGNASNAFGVRHPVPGPLVGTVDTATAYQAKNGGGGGVQTLIPWRAELNPEASTAFTVEAWIQPHVEVTDAPGPAPIMNRYSYPGVNRQGWVYFQRSPATGWNFRTYTGNGGSTGVDITGQASTPGAGTAGSWNHLVTVWDGATSTATMYINGEKVAEGTGEYLANTDDHDPAEATRGAAGIAIGSYNNTQLGENPFDGAVAEFALYNTGLTPDRIAAHYAAGTNALRSASYATVVLADLPVEYLRLNDPAVSPVTNSGSLGEAADGSMVFTSPGQGGPWPPAFPGFEANNTGVTLDGVRSYVTLNNPDGLNLEGKLTLEAWIMPASTQTNVANIVAHGQPTDDVDQIGLRIVDGTTYSVGVWNTTDQGASAAIPAADLAGGAWVHLAGTYDGSKWSLYRNGTLVASKAGTGPVKASADWAIGQRGRGTGQAFTGAVDEVAIYNQSLTADRILAHYQAATASAAPITLSISKPGSPVTITYSGGTLEQADAVTGPFSDVNGAASPYVPTSTTTGARFYRVRR